jgi:hypothetical protein
VLDGLLAAEYGLRMLCTRLHAALWLLPAAGLLVLRCALFHRFWTCRGIHFEAQRLQCACSLAACALLLGVAAEDTGAQRFDTLVRQWDRAARDAWNRARGRAIVKCKFY